MTGVFDALPPLGEDAGDGPLLVLRDVPFAEIRRLREAGAEVWPGAWRADHIEIVEEPSL
jgi:hypothetical protein